MLRVWFILLFSWWFFVWFLDFSRQADDILWPWKFFSCFLEREALSVLLQDYPYQLRTELLSMHTYNIERHKWRAIPRDVEKCHLGITRDRMRSKWITLSRTSCLLTGSLSILNLNKSGLSLLPIPPGNRLNFTFLGLFGPRL